MITTPQEYLASAHEQGQRWLAEFFRYMDEKHPDLKITMFRQCPMYKFKKSYLDGYIMFTVASQHFTLHTLDFELIEAMKNQLPKARFGKGCVKVKFKDVEAIPVLKAMCDKAVERQQTNNGQA